VEADAAFGESSEESAEELERGPEGSIGLARAVFGRIALARARPAIAARKKGTM
jgi:hypothetical protein